MITEDQITLIEFDHKSFKFWQIVFPEDSRNKDPANFEGFLKEFKKDERERYFFIFDENLGLPVGIIGIFNIMMKKFRSGMIEIFIKEDRRRKGYGSTSVQKFCDYCFFNLNLLRINAVIEPNNLASLGLFYKNGFEFSYLDNFAFFENNLPKSALVLKKLSQNIAWNLRKEVA